MLSNKSLLFTLLLNKNLHGVLTTHNIISMSFFCPIDEKQVRNLVVWLEDQKIRFYNTTEREPIRDTDSQYWIGALKKVITYFEFNTFCYTCPK